MSMIFTETQTMGNPAAGAGFVAPVPTGKTWLVKSLRFALVTSATVATRLPYIVISNGSSSLYQGGAAATIAASTTAIVNAGIQSPTYTSPAAGGSTLLNIYLPEVWIPAGGSIQGNVLGMQTGDQISQIAIGYQTA